MEHSLLHALALAGLITAVGGPLLILGLLRPAERAWGIESEQDEFGRALGKGAARWVVCGALLAAAATLLDLFVQVAELRGKTVFSGVDIAEIVRFATRATVGRLSLARAGALLLMAAATLVPGRHKWSVTGLLGCSAIVLTSLVSHAAAQPVGRYAAIAVQVAHISGAAIWMGVLIQLLLARGTIQRASSGTGVALVAEIVRRFSPVALIVVSLLVLSGVLAAWRYLGGVGALFTSAYGLTLLVKLALLTLALFAGLVNYRIIRPRLLAMDRSNADAVKLVLRRFGRMLELEVTAGLLVITVAGILASVSPPGQNGSLRLTERQTDAFLEPRLPAVRMVNPATFYGAAPRTVDDLHYSEFTHHWSGVMVCLLGLCWLAQAGSGRAAEWGGRSWPFLLVPFAAFVVVASDPEVWWLRRISIGHALSDPQLLEHQLGGGMILLLAWLGWRDRRRAGPERPLGYALPIIMVLGSLSLLGHAHSTLITDDALANLINVQHAVFGAFGLIAGTVRWLGLRGLFPRQAARWLWPGLVIGLGLFMTFCYREVV
ncbi:MAG: Copper resistance domain protein [Pedosphaera sp.]|nr:Copper resistance domain protein [Pedosphaera sp.]